MNIIDKVGWIHVEKRTLLLVRSKGKDMFYFPGGKREEGESDLESLARELKEELGIDLQLETAHYFGTFRAEAHGQEVPTHVEAILYTGAFDGKLEPQSEIEEMAWFSHADFNRLTPLARQVVTELWETGMID